MKDYIMNRNIKDKTWPFDQPKNCAVITLKQIIDHEVNVLDVYHDLDDHGWQFLSNIEVKEKDAKVVSLSSIVRLDETVLEIAKIPPGFRAYRKDKNSKWKIEKN